MWRNVSKNTLYTTNCPGNAAAGQQHNMLNTIARLLYCTNVWFCSVEVWSLAALNTFINYIILHNKFSCLKENPNLFQPIRMPCFIFSFCAILKRFMSYEEMPRLNLKRFSAKEEGEEEKNAVCCHTYNWIYTVHCLTKSFNFPKWPTQNVLNSPTLHSGGSH